MSFTDRIQYLFGRYMQKTCTREELQELLQYIADPANRPYLSTLMDAEYDTLQPLAVAPDADWEFMFQQAVQLNENNVVPFSNPNRFRWMRIAVAAILVLLAGVTGYWLINRPAKNKMAEKVQPVQQHNDVQPGTNKAVLTLANGSVIDLDSAVNGTVANEGKTIVTKRNNGQLEYSAIGNRQSAMIAYNMLSTPRGGQYQLVLPDGSKVWLNAASSIRYPVEFAGDERRVELTGEAYFEVAKDKARPFHVAVNGMQVEVLGTHFNINAYNDEEVVKTTLLEGSVKVVNRETGKRETGKPDEFTAVLKPGEQAEMAANSPLTTHHSPFTIHHSPDIETIMAWKNGLTAFKSADLKSIMRQVSRWYNVDVVYDGNIPQRSFTGGISRNAPLSELLRLLEVSKVRFRIEGNKLIVTP